MKRCPQCRRDYHDDTLLYCLDDGTVLLEGPASLDEPATAILSDPPTVPAGVTQHFAEAPTDRHQPPNTAGASDQSTASVAFNKRLLLLPIAAAVIVLGGFFAYRYLNPTASGPINSIAVLPFENQSSDTDTGYLSDGLAESLIFRLTQLPDLKVSPTSSVMRYKGKETDVATIASELGVDAVMTGRLSKRGDNLNITVELVDVRNNKSLWGEHYERKISELLATQREIATTITQKLQLKLSGDQAKGISKYTDNNEAFQLYLKGRYHFARRTKDDVLKSIEYYRQAANIAPQFALAYVGMAEAYTVGASNETLPRAEGIANAESAARKALELDPNLAEAHSALGFALMDLGFANWSEAEAAFKRSIEIDPNVANSHYYYSRLLQTVGRVEEGLTEMKRAVELEPLSLILNANLAGAYVSARQYERATIQIQKTNDLDPHFPPTQYYMCWILAVTARYEDILTDTYKQDPNLPGYIGYAYAKTGRVNEARDVLRTLKENNRSSEEAFVYMGLGDLDNAFVELEKAIVRRDPKVAAIKIDPLWDPLRDDPRYKNLLKRMGLPE